MTVGQKIQSSPDPWWAPRGRRPQEPKGFNTREWLRSLVRRLTYLPECLVFVWFPLATLASACLAVTLFWQIFKSASIMSGLFWFTTALIFLALTGFLFVCALGLIIKKFLLQNPASSGTVQGVNINMSLWAFGKKFLLKDWSWNENHHASIPAPELALSQFVQQVRAYANEKSFQKTRDQGHDRALVPPGAGGPLTSDSGDLLKRRWNEVVDSLGEFEIYLANEPSSLISKLVAKFPAQNMDVSQVFREVAESFDSTWRRRGITIEAAIVTPLRATVHDGLLRRLLVGPWRAGAYLARRGNGVVFSAKQWGGAVSARWEISGLTIAQDLMNFLQDRRHSVSQRIEQGMSQLSQDPNNPHVLFGLLSLILWIDLAQEAKIPYELKNNHEGFVVEMKLLER